MARGPPARVGEAGEVPCAQPDTAAKATFQEGDLVVLGPLVLPEHCGRPAVVTKVGASSCTVALLDDARRAALGECWPGLGDLTLESCKGRVGTHVRVQGLSSSSTSWCNGLTGRVAPHPLEGHPCFIRKSGLPGTPVLVLCIELDPGQGARQKRVLLEPRFVLPCEQVPALELPKPEPAPEAAPTKPALPAEGAPADPATGQEPGTAVEAARAAEKATAGPGRRSLAVRLFEDYYAVFLYGAPLERRWMAISILTFDAIMALLVICYLAAPLIILWVDAAGAFHLATVCLLALQALTTVCVPRGELELLVGGAAAGERDGQPPKRRGPLARPLEAFRGCCQGLASTWWVWHMSLQVAALQAWQLHALLQLLAAVAAGLRGQLRLAAAAPAAGLVAALLGAVAGWQPRAVRAALGASLRPAAAGSWCATLWPLSGFGCRRIASNIEFAKGLHLDLYGSTRGPPCGVLLWLHGGGWVCSSRGPNALARALGGQGWLVCSCDYRPCRGEAGVGLQQQLADVAAAAAWLRAHAADFGAEGLPLCIGGVSAGAHLAALASGRLRPAALVLSSGLRAERAALARHPTLLHVLENHALRGSDAGAWRAADAVACLANSSPPPTALLHGTADIISPVESSRAVRAALQVARPGSGGLFYLELPGGPHGWDFLASPAVAEVASALHAFLSKAAFSGSAGAGAPIHQPASRRAGFNEHS